MASDDLLIFILKNVELSTSLLVEAILKKNTGIIEKMVNSLPSIDEKKRDDIIWGVIHATPISELTSEVFEMLIKNGPSTYRTSYKLVRRFSPHDGHKIYFTDQNPDSNFNLLDYCVTKKRSEILRKLLEKYNIDILNETYDDHSYSYDCDWRYAPHLFIALMNNDYDGAKLLMEYGADINQICAPTEREIPLHIPYNPLCYQVLKYCPRKDEGELTEFMLNHGADLSDSEKLRECCKNESIIKKIEDFYKEPKKRAKPDQD